MRLRVLFPDAMLVMGKKSGKKYVYVPGRDKGFLEVDDVDVEDILKMTYTSGCNCGTGSRIKRNTYFAKETNL